jgi:hypothetical protein
MPASFAGTELKATFSASSLHDTSCEIHERTMMRGSPRDSRSDEKKKYAKHAGDADDGWEGVDDGGPTVVFKCWIILAQRMVLP